MKNSKFFSKNILRIRFLLFAICYLLFTLSSNAQVTTDSTGINQDAIENTLQQTDATDVNLDVVLEQFTLMLSAMDYVVDGKHLELVENDTYPY